MELSVEQALQQGIAAHKKGELQEAERLYRAILLAQPLHPDANHNLGVLAVSVNKTAAALPLLKTALESDPEIEQFWLSYIDALIIEQQYENAEQAFEQAKTRSVARDKLNALESQFTVIVCPNTPKLVAQKKSPTLFKKRQKLAQQKKKKKAKKLGLKGISPSQEQLNSLLEHYQNGRFNDAEKLAVFITNEFPKHQFAWKVLGTVLNQLGRISESLVAKEKAVKLDTNDAEAHSNLGNSFKELGRLDEAEASYIQAIALKPDYAEAHSNLGNTFKELGRLDEAEASYQQAIALKPDYVEAHSNLGVTLHELGRLDEALASYTQAVALKPDFVQAHSNLGVTLQELGRLDDAKASYIRAIALKPDYAKAHSNLGNALKEQGKLDEALLSYKQAIALKPDYAEAHSNLGNVFKELGRLDEAEASYVQAIALKPHYAEAHSNLGNVFKELGRLDEAEASYVQAIALKPDYAEAHRHLALIKRFDSCDGQYSKMLELYLNEDISEEQRCHINFGLAKACEDLGNFEQAYTHYGEGNMLRKKLLNYDINQDVEFFRQIKLNYSQIENNTLASRKFPKKVLPVFIVGMPRSGTTLVEQIISSHSLVTGAGELNFASQFGAAISTGFTEINNESLLEFRHNYLNKLQNFSKGNLIVTDKMPQNFYYIGLLAATLPEARIIHVKRNPAAVCWANYKQYFSSKSIGYCYAIDDVVSYYKLYENLMDFWTTKLSNKIYNLDYELLTVNQERETRKLTKFLGLDWDEKCLSPQLNTRSIATASSLQVRQKVYRGSSEQWKQYQPFLGRAFDELPLS